MPPMNRSLINFSRPSSSPTHAAAAAPSKRHLFEHESLGIDKGLEYPGRHLPIVPRGIRAISNSETVFRVGHTASEVYKRFVAALSTRTQATGDILIIYRLARYLVIGDCW